MKRYKRSKKYNKYSDFTRSEIVAELYKCHEAKRVLSDYNRVLYDYLRANYGSLFEALHALDCETLCLTRAELKPNFSLDMVLDTLVRAYKLGVELEYYNKYVAHYISSKFGTTDNFLRVLDLTADEIKKSPDSYLLEVPVMIDTKSSEQDNYVSYRILREDYELLHTAAKARNTTVTVLITEFARSLC